MVALGLLATLEAMPGKEAEVEDFLRSGGEMAQNEPATVTWYALKLGPSTYGVFDTFEDEAGRDAHLQGDIAAALIEKAPDLFSEQPQIAKVAILATKLPE